MNNPGKESKIYTFYYQPIKIISAGNNYIPVWAGKNNKPDVKGFIGDDSGENISEKNKYYSELTGLYWVWKNTNSDVIGSCHYRRYFTAAKEPFIHQMKRMLYFPVGLYRKRFGLIYTNNIQHWKPKILSTGDAEKILEDFDIILPTRRKLRQTLKKHYNKHHNPSDLVLLRKIIAAYFPEYLNSYDSILDNDQLFANNMFITRRNTFDSLMEWIFFILFKFEEKTDLEHYKGYQERIFGFLAERLITLWVVHNQLRYKELPLIYFKKMKYQSND